MGAPPTTTKPAVRSALFLVAVAALGAVAVAVVLAEEAEASHYRGGTMYATPEGNNFRIEGRMSYRTSWGGAWGCAPGVVGPAGSFNTPAISIRSGSPTGPVIGTAPFNLMAMSCNGANDWFVGKIVTPVTNADGVLFTTPNANIGQTLYATWDNTARINNAAPNFHRNNPSTAWRLETELVPGNSPPRPFVPPVVQCPTTGLCSIPIPFADNDFNDTHDLRWATPAETGAASFVQPGPCGACGSPAPATLYDGGSTNFRLNWTTTGATVAGPCQTLFSTHVMINDTVAKVPMEWLIRLCDGTPPHWVTPPTACSETLTTVQGSTISFPVRAASVDAARVVTISVLEYPTGATYVVSPGYTMPANPTQITFTWDTTGRPLGDYLAVFYAEDDMGLTAQTCSVNIRLLPPPVPDFTFEFQTTGMQLAPGYPGPYQLTYDDVIFTDDSDITCFNYLMPCGIPPPAVSWAWDFNDPYDTTPGVSSSTMHVYTVATNAGTVYPACMTLTVSYSFQWQGEVCKNVTVFNRPPNPAPRPTLSVGGTVSFADFGGDIDGSVASCTWEFGDGATLMQDPCTSAGIAGVRHSYARDGIYTVCLRIVDNAGSTNRNCVDIRIRIPVPWSDIDLDGVTDAADNCASVPNPSQADRDGDGFGDACANEPPLAPRDPDVPIPPADLQATDFDFDGVADEADNCPWTPNRDQMDHDGDLAGDHCDADLDGDGHDQWGPPGSVLDNCPTVPNPDQADTDRNGGGDACEGVVLAGLESKAEPGPALHEEAGDASGLFGAEPAAGVGFLLAGILLLVVGAVGTSFWAVRRWGR